MAIPKERYDEIKHLLRLDPERAKKLLPPPLGYGSARNVYGLQAEGRAPTVVKILADDSSENIEQMLSEIRCLRKMQGHPLVPELIDWDMHYFYPRWVQIEYLPTAEGYRGLAEAFRWRTGLPWEEFRKRLEAHPRMQSRGEFVDAMQGIGSGSYSATFLWDLAELVDHCGLMPIDFSIWDNWGFQRDGTMKLIDLGLSSAQVEGNPPDIEAIKQRLMAWNPGEKPYKYWRSCVDFTSGELVQYLVDRAEQITYTTFARHADLDELRAWDHPAMYRLSRPDNWAVSFWKTRLPSGQQVYYFDWSAIEHFFVDAPVDLENEMALLQEAEPNPLPALPVIKRGMVPRLIVGQYGTSAYYTYRGYAIEVSRPSLDRWWDVTVTPPPGSAKAAVHFPAKTYDGAVCSAKIKVDLDYSLETIEPGSDSHYLLYFWHLVYKIAQRQMMDYGKITRASVARRLETDMRSLRTERPHSVAWWMALDPRTRVQLIDDRLEAAYCTFGTNWRDWPHA